MARVSLHNVAPNWRATLDATINDSALSVVLSSSGSSGAPDVPFKFHIDQERLRCSAITVDTPSAGKDTLTVTRGADGTTPASHLAGATVSQKASAYDHQELVDRVDLLTYALDRILGGGSGVQRTAANTDLKVTAQASPNMTVRAAAGAALVVNQIAAIYASTNSATIVAPSANPRIDVIQIDQSGNIEVKTGVEAGSPSAPAVDADALKLAEVYLRVGATSIKDTDDSTNGYITDARVFL